MIRVRVLRRPRPLHRGPSHNPSRSNSQSLRSAGGGLQGGVFVHENLNTSYRERNNG